MLYYFFGSPSVLLIYGKLFHASSFAPQVTVQCTLCLYKPELLRVPLMHLVYIYLSPPIGGVA